MNDKKKNTLGRKSPYLNDVVPLQIEPYKIHDVFSPSLCISIVKIALENPNSYKSLRRDTTNSWSKLPLDLLNLVFEHLSFADFQRAKSVCSSWFSASTTVTKNQIPLLLLFPENNHENSCMLFNPEEKEILYKTQDLGLEFAKSSVCIATYGSWLLLQDSKYNLHILNLFTRERINLPPVESQLGVVKVKRTIHDCFRVSHDHHESEFKCMDIRSAVFWIEEKFKYYIVLWGLGHWCVVSATKGDTSWNQIPKTSDCLDILYKDHKLYFLSKTGILKILDFYGGMDNKTFVRVSIDRFISCFLPLEPMPCKLVVTVTGNVLKVESILRPISRIESFRVYKFDLSGLFKGYKRVDSLGDEAMLLDLGITVPANDFEGFKRNCIYFSGGRHGKNTTDIFIFNLETQKMEILHKFDCSSLRLYRARWFLPSSTHT